MRFTIAVLASILGSMSAHWAHATVIYSEDFSGDPGWTTNKPTMYYWDSSNEWLHIENENSSPGWMYKQVAHTGGSFVLEFDIYPNDVQFDSHVGLGILDDYTKCSDTWPDNFLRIEFGHGAPTGGVQWRFSTSGGSHEWETAQVGAWYHVALSYDESAQLARADLTKEGTPFASKQVAGLTLSHTVDYYLVSNDDRTHSRRVSTGYIDNIGLSAPSGVPEPSSCALLAIAVGGIGLALNRRQRKQRADH